MIPKIIHQIYWDFGMGKKPPNEWENKSKTIRDMHPNWVYMRWNLRKLTSLVKTHFNWFYYKWAQLNNIEKCDTARFIILYLYGGYYLDMDITTKTPLDKLCKHDIVIYNEENLTKYIFNTMYLFNNCFIGSIPKHNFWLKCLNHVQNINIHKLLPYSLQILFTGGPLALQYIYYNNKSNLDNICIIKHPSKLFIHEKKMTWRTSEIKWKEVGIFLIALGIILGIVLGIVLGIIILIKHVVLYCMS